MKKTHNQGSIEFCSLAVHKLTSILWSQSVAAKGVVYLITTVHVQIPHACCHNSWAHDLAGPKIALGFPHLLVYLFVCECIHISIVTLHTLLPCNYTLVHLMAALTKYWCSYYE